LSGTTVLAFLAVAMLVAVGVWFGAKRKKELAAWAAKAGLTFSSGTNRSFDNRYPQFGCLRRGHSRCAYNIATGLWNGRPLEAFDYRYVTGQGKDRTTHTFSAIILGSALPLKPLHIRSENVLDKLTEFLGADDIDFESDQFSREFHVKSPDKKWAYDVLHQRTMEFLLSRPKFSIEFDTESVICWRNRRFDVRTRESAIGVVEGILDRLPEYVVREQGRGEP
jgi:hypothetical protein